MNSRLVLACMALIGALLNSASAPAIPYAATLLHPIDYTTSIANDTSATNQVGAGRGGTHPTLDHALLWHDTAESVVDLHPAIYTKSFAIGASESKQVGYGQDADGFN